MNKTTGFDDIDGSIASLSALAAWRSAHPEIPGLMANATLFSVHPSGTHLSPLGSITKNLGGDNDELMFVKRDFGFGVKVSYHAERDEVCTRRVVGTELVDVPDPDAPLVKVEREIVEWDCAPILAAS